MKKADFDRLLEAVNFALAYERGEAVKGRVTVREVPAKPTRQVRVPLDPDIVEEFKRRANGASYQTQINQALRQILNGNIASTGEQNEAPAQPVAEIVAAARRRKKAA